MYQIAYSVWPGVNFWIKKFFTILGITLMNKLDLSIDQTKQFSLAVTLYAFSLKFWKESLQ